MDTRARRFFDDIKGKKVDVCGIGISNRPLIDKLLEHGAIVTACDKNTKEQLGDITDQLEAKGVTLRLGEHYLDNLDGDIIFRTPGMKYYLPQLQQARHEGKVVTSEMEVFFAMCAARIIAVTGSDGKTTTTTIISKLLEQQGHKVWVGGNIGSPLLPKVQNIAPQDFAVVELSSFQLISMRQSPNIAVVTNVAPNHLDIHKNMQEYVDAKKNIIAHQDGFGTAILNKDNDIALSFTDDARGKVICFSRKQPVSNGAYCDEKGDIYYCSDGEKTFIMNSSDILIPGEHNVENYLAAICAVYKYVDIDTIRTVAKQFGGVEHRIELVREVNGVKYYNDSIASSPSRTMAGLNALKQPIILIAGGYDKNIPFDVMGDVVAKQVKKLILMGKTAPKIEKAVVNSKYYDSNKTEIIHVSGMEEAVNVSHEKAGEGDIVLMSPACASFDMYKNFEQRGKHFKLLVNSL